MENTIESVGFDRRKLYERQVREMSFAEFVQCAVVVRTLQGKCYVNLFNGAFINQNDCTDITEAPRIYRNAKRVLNQRMVVIARRRYWDRSLCRVKLVLKNSCY